MTAASRPTLPTRCGVCEKPLDPTADDAVLAVRDAELAKAIERHDADVARSRRPICERVMSIDELMAWESSAARWRAGHEACIFADGNAYALRLVNLRTWPGVVEWTSHLAEKDWLVLTDWSDVLRRMLG